MGQGKSVTLKSLPEQNGTGTGVRKMSRKRSHTITGVCTWNGIEPCNQIGIQSSSSSGLHIRSYYTIEDEEECVKRESGTSRMVSLSLPPFSSLPPCHPVPLQLSLKRCLQRAHNDLNKLRQLQCPYIVTAVGIHFSPPRYIHSMYIYTQQFINLYTNVAEGYYLQYVCTYNSTSCTKYIYSRDGSQIYCLFRRAIL